MAALFRAEPETAPQAEPPSVARSVHEARRLRQAGDIDGALAVLAGMDTAKADPHQARWAYAEWSDLAKRRFGDRDALVYSQGTGKAAAQPPGSPAPERRCVMVTPNAIPIETYGVELHRDRAEEAEKRLGRALASDLFATSVANGAFGLLLLNPPYDHDSEDKRTEHAFLTQTTRYLAEGGLLVFIVPRQRLAVSARYLSTHYGRMRCWAFPHPEREVFDQVVLMGYRKADPVPDPHGESMALEWAVGEPEPMRPDPYPPFTPKTTPSGDILFTTRTVDPVAAAAEARRSGLWTSTEITDTLWPARDTRTRPLMPLRRGHMAMLVAAGFLDNLCLEAEGRRILVKGRTSKEMVMVEDSPEKEVHREKLKTTVVALDLHDGEITDIAA